MKAKPLKLEFVGPFSVHSGYAQAFHDTAMALVTAGIDFSITPLHDADTEDLDPRYGCLIDRVKVFDDPTHVMVHTIPRYAHEFVNSDLEPAAGVKKICYSTWETDKLPASDVTTLEKHFDYILWPSRFSLESALRGGMDETKTGVIGHAFDPRFWWPEDPPIPDDVPYTFYCIGLWNERKAPISLLKAYLTEFGPEDNVLLKFVAQDVINSDVEHLGKCSGLKYLPPVEFIRTRLDEVALRNLHHRSHCYVTLARGEAWALGAFEATIVGNPVISVDFGGQWEFLAQHSQAIPVHYTLTPAITPEVKAQEPIVIGGIQITPMKRAVPTGIAGDQNWAEPDVHHAKARMRHAYEHRLKRSNENRDWLRKYFSYSAIGAQWRRFLEEV
jgi:glycosyltransferase involved in cell wall biosynthesis